VEPQSRSIAVGWRLKASQKPSKTVVWEFYHRVVRLRTLQEAQAKLRAWEHEDNHLRPHLALRGRTPVERLREPRITTPRL